MNMNSVKSHHSVRVTGISSLLSHIEQNLCISQPGCNTIVSLIVKTNQDATALFDSQFINRCAALRRVLRRSSCVFSRKLSRGGIETFTEQFSDDLSLVNVAENRIGYDLEVADRLMAIGGSSWDLLPITYVDALLQDRAFDDEFVFQINLDKEVLKPLGLSGLQVQSALDIRPGMFLEMKINFFGVILSVSEVPHVEVNL